MWRPVQLGDVIAERTFLLKRRGKRDKRVVVCFGHPVRGARVSRRDPWWCPLQIGAVGLDRVTPIAGEDSLQALALALRFVERVLPAEARRLRGTVEWLGERKWPVFGGSDILEAQENAISNLTTALAEALFALEQSDTPRKPSSLPSRRLRQMIDRRGFVPPRWRLRTNSSLSGRAKARRSTGRYAAFDRAAFLAAMTAIGHERSAVTIPESCHSEAASISNRHSPDTDERP